MLHLPPNLLDQFLVIDVRDPDELGDDSAVSRRFPRTNNTHRYRLRRGVRTEAGAPDVLTRLAMAFDGDLMACYVADRHATEVQIVPPGLDRYSVSAVLSGSLTLTTPGGRQALGAAAHGLVLRGSSGARFVSSDNTARFNLWVTAARVESMLTALLGMAPARRVEFEPVADFSHGGGAGLLRLLGLYAQELAQGGGLTANPIALNTFTDLWVQTMLHGLAHNHRDAMQARHHAAPVPRHIKRAEDFMRQNAAGAIALSAVADAAGCSLRTLHAAFRRFRDTTPLAALQGIRLDAVRAQLHASTGDCRPAEIARRHGFSNAGRFKTAYLRRFGVPPPGPGRR